MSKEQEGAFNSTTASVLLDAYRGVAALLVCLAHWAYLYFVNYPEVTVHRRLLYIPSLICSMGHQAVTIFFVMSGYLVGGHVLRAVSSNRWSWPTYLVQRGARLWTVLLPALLFGLVLDQIAVHLGISPRLYSGTLTQFVTYDIAPTLTWKVFLGNLFFCQTILTPVLGSNTSLWSLAYEAWYYLMFPLALLPIRGKQYSSWQRVVMVVLLVCILLFVGRAIRNAFVIWLMGVVLSQLPTRSTASWLRWMTAGLYAVFLVAVSQGIVPPRFHPDICLGAATMLMLWTMLGAKAPAGKAWYVRPSRISASFSYTLYLVHAPLMVFMTLLHPNEQRWQPNVAHLTLGIGVLIFVIGIAYIFAALTEFHTAAVKDWAMKVLTKAEVRQTLT